MCHGMGTIITGGLTKNYHTMSHREKILFSPPEFLNNNQAKNKMAAENDDSTYFLSWAELYKYNDTD